MKFKFNDELFVDIDHKLDMSASTKGLIIVDEVNGFCKPGSGNLAPAKYDQMISDMVANTNYLAERFTEKQLPIMAFMDCHKPDIPEPPYPPHCVAGTGEDELVEKLKWLEKYDKFTPVLKDCINGYIGSLNLDTGLNRLEEWINENCFESVVVVGICTDICVLQLVQTILSARNHGLFHKGFKDVVVSTYCCATYDLPINVARDIGLPDTAAHPRELSERMGFYFMAQSGAILTKEIIV